MVIFLYNVYILFGYNTFEAHLPQSWNELSYEKAPVCCISDVENSA